MALDISAVKGRLALCSRAQEAWISSGTSLHASSLDHERSLSCRPPLTTQQMLRLQQWCMCTITASSHGRRLLPSQVSLLPSATGISNGKVIPQSALSNHRCSCHPTGVHYALYIVSDIPTDLPLCKIAAVHSGYRDIPGSQDRCACRMYLLS